jgi:pimeloyl-ACP methyl ester carboxylesterase
MNDMEEKTYDTGSVPLNYAEGNNRGDSLLLLHGGSSRWQSFENIIPDLSSSWHIYALDLRGHGKSGRVYHGYNIEHYMKDVVSFIQGCIEKPTIIFGHSMGGMVALMVASYYPDKVKGIVIGDSPISRQVLKEHFNRQREMTILWRDLAKTGDIKKIVAALKKMPIPIPGQKDPVPASEIFGKDHPWFNFMGESLRQNDPDMLSSIIDRFDETYCKYNVYELLVRIKCPVLILQADPEQGGLIRDEDVEKAMNVLPHVQHIRFHGVGHALHMQNKEEVLKALIPFFRNI